MCWSDDEYEAPEVVRQGRAEYFDELDAESELDVEVHVRPSNGASKARRVTRRRPIHEALQLAHGARAQTARFARPSLGILSPLP